MRPNLGTFFDEADLNRFAGFICQLLQADRCRKTGWPSPDDHNIKFHGFAFHNTPSV